MKDLQVKYTDPLDLIPYENNPRINDYAVKKVMESIKEYELVMLSNRYNEYVESTPDEGFITWLLKRGL